MKKVPTLADLQREIDAKLTPEEIKAQTLEQEFTHLLNQNPPKEWVKSMKVVDNFGKEVQYKYIPIDRITWMLVRLFGSWESNVTSVTEVCGGIAVTVSITLTHPINKECIYVGGIGWCAIGKGANGQMAAPTAETLAIKRACEKLGRLFGKDLNREDEMNYDGLLKEVTQEQELQKLLDAKKQTLKPAEVKRFQEIIDTKETKSYEKIKKILS